MLVVALVLAVLYFMLMTLVMIDSSRAQGEAQRFRARVMAAALAENGAELACAQMVKLTSNYAQRQDEQGTLTGKYYRGADKFTVEGDAVAGGLIKQKASVKLTGTVDEAGHIRIDWSNHSQ